MSSKKKGFNIKRFAIGSPEHIQSSVWRMWVQGDEVYLGAREALTVFKVSLHKSGIWRIAFVKDLHREDSISDRVIVKWEKPGEFAPGWTPSVAILLSSIKPKYLLNQKRMGDPRIEWFPAPSEGRKFLFKVLFSKPGLSQRECESIILPTDRIVCQMRKANGGTVWLVLREEDLLLSERQRIEDVMKKTKIHLKPGASEESIIGSRALLVVSEDKPTVSTQPTILDIPLGKENPDIPASVK